MGNIKEKCAKPNPKKSHRANHSKLNMFPARSPISSTNPDGNVWLQIAAIEASNRQSTGVARCLLPKSAVPVPMTTKIKRGQLSEKASSPLFTRNSSAKTSEAKSSKRSGVIAFRSMWLWFTPFFTRRLSLRRIWTSAFCK